MLNATCTSAEGILRATGSDLLERTPFGAPLTVRVALKTSLQAAILGSFYAWIALSIAFIASSPAGDRFVATAVILASGVATYFSLLSVLMPLSALLGSTLILYLSSRIRFQLSLTLGMIGAAIGICFSPLALLAELGFPAYLPLLIGFAYGAAIGLVAGYKVQQLVGTPTLNIEP